MNRRGFLKGLAGLASLPIVGKMATSAKAPMVREGIANVAGVVQDAPIYFWKLVDKIRNLGKDVTETASTLDTQKVKQYKDYELTEDLTTGQIEIQRIGRQSDDAYINEQASEDVFMTYRPSEKILLDEANPAGGVQKTMPEYEEFTAYVSNNRGNTGEILEEVSGVPDDIKLDAELEMELFRKGKADGGIISLADGGRVRMVKGGIPKGLQAAMQALRKKFGDDIIKSGDEIESRSELFDDFAARNPDPNKQLTDDEYQAFIDELGGADQLEAYDFDGTIGDAQRILKEQEEFTAEMFSQYKMGKLDPVAGDKSPARKRFLQQKFDEMEASGDSKLMTRDEIEELSTFDLGTQMDQMKPKSIIPENEYQSYKNDFDKEILNKEIKQGVADVLSDTSPAGLAKSIEIDNLMLKYPGMTKDLADQIASSSPRMKADMIAMVEQTFKMSEKGMSGDDIIQTFKNTTRTKQADGGIIGLTAMKIPDNSKSGVESLFKRR